MTLIMKNIDMGCVKMIRNNVLIQPAKNPKSKSNLILIQDTKNKEVAEGYVVRVGDGVPVEGSNLGGITTIPLQMEVGDFAIYLTESAVNVKYNNEDYIIVPDYNILMVERPD